MSLIKYCQKWTSKEDDYLLQNYVPYNFDELAKAMKRTPSAIKARLHKLRKE
jgi:predicted transcriptional regulator